MFKTELIKRQGPWRTVEQVEAETMHDLDWFNNTRLLEVNGDVPPESLRLPTRPTHERPASSNRRPAAPAAVPAVLMVGLTPTSVSVMSTLPQHSPGSLAPYLVPAKSRGRAPSGGVRDYSLGESPFECVGQGLRRLISVGRVSGP